MKNPYTILGVSKSATQEEIKKAYKALVRKNHPDLNPGNKQAEARFKEITHAYDQIGTSEARSKFDHGDTDEQLHENYARQQKYWEEALKHGKRGPGKSSFYNTQQNGGRYSQTFGDEFTNNEFFEELFRGAGKSRRAQKGSDTLFQIEVSLADAVLGSEKVITLPNGKTISVKIPAGVKSGTKLRFKGLGEASTEGLPPGDAYIEIIVMPAKGFKRVGNDIEVEVPISFIEAILGTEISVPTLYGPILMKIPPGTNNGSKLRIRGKGVQSDTNSGNQIVQIKIVMPKNLSPKLQAAVRNWNGEFDYNPRGSDENYSYQSRNEQSENSHHI